MLQHYFFTFVYVYTFVGNHCLVNGILIVLQELILHCRHNGAHSLQPMETRLIPQRQCGDVGEVEVAGDFFKLFLSDPGGNVSIVQPTVERPVIPGS